VKELRKEQSLAEPFAEAINPASKLEDSALKDSVKDTPCG
jgi:hypothetical protein